MNKKSMLKAGALATIAVAALSACSSGTASPSNSATTSSATTSSSVSQSAQTPLVLPVQGSPIVNNATAAVLTVTKAAVEDNVDPATGKAINDRLQLTLKNTGTSTLTGFEAFYTMTDRVTKSSESYYQKLDGLSIPAGQSATVYFDNQTGAGHYPENQFSIYRSSTNAVDFAITVSAQGAKTVTVNAVKSKGTGEKLD